MKSSWTEDDRDTTLRAIGFANRQIVTAWTAREPSREIPWTPLRKPLRACRVALVSTAALAVNGDRPFDQVAFAGAHNAMSNSDDGWLLPDQVFVVSGVSFEFYEVQAGRERGDVESCNALIPPTPSP